jgi:hypothetical protein
LEALPNSSLPLCSTAAAAGYACNLQQSAHPQPMTFSALNSPESLHHLACC